MFTFIQQIVQYFFPAAFAYWLQRSHSRGSFTAGGNGSLRAELTRICWERGRSVWISPACSEADLRVLIDLASAERRVSNVELNGTFKPTGVHTQIGGNRVYLTADGIAVRERRP